MEQNVPSQRQGVSAALAAAQARAAVASAVRFPGEDGGRSLAEMAQRDLDAALHLLADRAQYITGASGAAIALRRDGRDDMLCRASVGSTAPELGALLSTEFGLSGESVRTRQLLRCDDAERDARVNREVCRQMGIASVLVMPVVNDDQVLGVFELFSGKANAFGERDLSAVQRLSEMVETAVRLAHATETLPQQLSERESSVAEAIHPEVFEGQFLGDLVVEDAKPQHEAPPVQQPPLQQSIETIAAAALESPLAQEGPLPIKISTPASHPEPKPKPQLQPIQSPAPVAVVPAKEPLFWSAAAPGDEEATNKSQGDQSHVPPVLRGLRKCDACGFPVSAGRALCVECEEKKWRGQLRPKAPERKATSAVATRPTSNSSGTSTAAATSMVKIDSPSTPASELPPDTPAPAVPSAAVVASAPELAVTPSATSQRSASAQELVLSAGLEPSRSWVSANKYILGALLLIGIAVTGLILLH